MSSRLFQEVREKRGLCYSIFAQTGAYADTGMTTIYAGTSAEDIGALAEITADEMKRVAGDLGEAEVARARAQLKAGLLIGLESPSARAERLARMAAPPPVPSTAVYSRTDGIVDWRSCLEPAAPETENVEVAGSHCGLGVNPLALYAIADRLAQPEGDWRPFEPEGLLGLLYCDSWRDGE